MSLTVDVNTDNRTGKTDKKPVNKAAASKATAPTKKPSGATDDYETANGKPKLTKILYEIKDGDSLTKIAAELGIKMTDLVDELKAQGKLPKDYDVNTTHDHDIPWMKKGNKIKVSYPATQKQKDDYEAFCEKRTHEYYNKKAKKEAAQKEAEHQKRLTEYEALPWYKKIFTSKPY